MFVGFYFLLRHFKINETFIVKNNKKKEKYNKFLNKYISYIIQRDTILILT